MIFSGLKLGMANKKIAPLLRNRSVSVSGGPVKSMGVLLDSASTGAAENFSRFSDKHGIKKTDFSVITCLESKPKADVEEGVFCLPGDIDWKGKFSRTEVQEFLDRKFDVLLCFTEKDTALTRYMVGGAKAGLKIGRSEDAGSGGAGDISIAVAVEDSDLFLIEVEKYLRIFNMLK